MLLLLALIATSFFDVKKQKENTSIDLSPQIFCEGKWDAPHENNLF